MAAYKYRTSGHMSGKSLKYIAALELAGWQPAALEAFIFDLPRFESSSIKRDFDRSMLTFMEPPDALHLPFLKTLNIYIRAIDDASRLEQLQSQALEGGKESLPANEILMRMSGDEEFDVTENKDGSTKVKLVVNLAK